MPHIVIEHSTHVEADLDFAACFFGGKGLPHALGERPYQGRPFTVADPFGLPLEFYTTMEKRERLLQKYDNYRGAHPQRLDHFNVFAPDVQGSIDFYAGIGFRLTEYAEEEPVNGGASPPPGCTARATCTTSPSPTASGPACTTPAIGLQRRCTSSIST
jgi:hypothetical protein